MPTVPFETFTGVKLEPYYYPQLAKTRAVNLAAGTYPAGQVLGQFTQAAVNEIQTLTATGTVSGGTYTITFEGQTTTALAFDATVAQVQAALNALSNVDSGDIVVAGGAFPATPLTFTFGGQYAARNASAMSVTDSTTGAGHTLTFTTPTPGLSGPGQYGAYATGNTDGTGVAVCFLVYPCTVNSDGVVQMTITPAGVAEQSQLTAPVYDQGYFLTTDLTGLDADAVVDLKARIVEGSLAAGVVYVP